MKLLTILVVMFTVGVARADEGSAAPAPAPVVSDARKACTDAMNADPTFEKMIVEIADKKAADKRLADTEAEHLDAAQHIAKDEKHVILAYAAMWIVAAGFVLFLFLRQQKLVKEIAALKRDLEKEAT